MATPYELPINLVKRLQELAAIHTLREFLILSEYKLPTYMTAYQFLHQDPNEFDFGELPLIFRRSESMNSSFVCSILLEHYEVFLDYAVEVADIMQQEISGRDTPAELVK